jgi:hypothetical protein
VYSFVPDYLEERRLALMRARAEAKNAPAEPTTARIAVGFSGESVQPSCACSGRATARRRAKPRNAKADFFIGGLHFGEVIDMVGRMDARLNCSVRKSCFGCTIWECKKNGCDLVPSGDFHGWPLGFVFPSFARH